MCIAERVIHKLLWAFVFLWTKNMPVSYSDTCHLFLQTWQISYTSFDTLNTRQCDDMSCKVCCLFRKAWCRQNTTKYIFSSHWLLLLQNRNPHWRCYICLTRRWHPLIIRHCCQPTLSSLLQNVTFKALFSKHNVCNTFFTLLKTYSNFVQFILNFSICIHLLCKSLLW